MAGKIPYPENLTPLDSPNMIYLGIDQYWWSLLFGLLTNINHARAWDVTEAEWETEVQPALLELMTVPDSCNPCGISIEINAEGKLELVLSPTISVEIDDLFVRNMYFDPITRTWSFDQGDSVLNFGDVSAIFQNSQTVVINELPEAPPIQDQICAGVTQLVLYVLAIADEIADNAQNVLDEINDIKTALEIVIESYWFGAAEAAPLDEIAELILSQNQNFITLMKDKFDDSFVVEGLQKDLYCAIRANNNEFSRDVFEQWATDSVDYNFSTSGFSFTFPSFLREIVGWNKVASRYRLYSTDIENDCRLLGWCDEPIPATLPIYHDWKVDIDQHNWALYGGLGGVWHQSTVGGWEVTLISGSFYRVYIQLKVILTSTDVLSSLQLFYYNNTNLKTLTMYVTINNEDHTQQLVNAGYQSAAAPNGDKTFSFANFTNYTGTVLIDCWLEIYTPTLKPRLGAMLLNGSGNVEIIQQ